MSRNMANIVNRSTQNPQFGSLSNGMNGDMNVNTNSIPSCNAKNIQNENPFMPMNNTGMQNNEDVTMTDVSSPASFVNIANTQKNNPFLKSMEDVSLNQVPSSSIFTNIPAPNPFLQNSQHRSPTLSRSASHSSLHQAQPSFHHPPSSLPPSVDQQQNLSSSQTPSVFSLNNQPSGFNSFAQHAHTPTLSQSSDYPSMREQTPVVPLVIYPPSDDGVYNFTIQRSSSPSLQNQPSISSLHQPPSSLPHPSFSFQPPPSSLPPSVDQQRNMSSFQTPSSFSLNNQPSGFSSFAQLAHTPTFGSKPLHSPTVVSTQFHPTPLSAPNNQQRAFSVFNFSSQAPGLSVSNNQPPSMPTFGHRNSLSVPSGSAPQHQPSLSIPANPPSFSILNLQNLQNPLSPSTFISQNQAPNGTYPHNSIPSGASIRFCNPPSTLSHQSQASNSHISQTGFYSTFSGFNPSNLSHQSQASNSHLSQTGFNNAFAGFNLTGQPPTIPRRMGSGSVGTASSWRNNGEFKPNPCLKLRRQQSFNGNSSNKFLKNSQLERINEKENSDLNEAFKNLPELPKEFAAQLNLNETKVISQPSQPSSKSPIAVDKVVTREPLCVGGGKMKKRRVAERGSRCGRYNPYAHRIVELPNSKDENRPIRAIARAKPNAIAGILAGMGVGAATIAMGLAAPAATAMAVACCGLTQWLVAKPKIEVMLSCPVCDKDIQWTSTPWTGWSTGGFSSDTNRKCPDCANDMALKGYQADAQCPQYAGHCPNCHDPHLLDNMSLPYESNWVTCQVCQKRSLVETKTGTVSMIAPEDLVNSTKEENAAKEEEIK